MKTILLSLIVFALPAAAAVEGVVYNGTTGREQPDVPVTLMKLEQGMVPAGTTRSDSYGKFRFADSAGGQPGPILLRAEFDGVTYNQMIPPGSRTGDVKVTVYRAAKAEGGAAAPATRIVLLEPSGREMAVNEFFLFQNASQPAVTYVNPQQGTLRFYLPASAKGVVQASATGPGGMPLRETAQKTDQPDVMKLNFAIKPGESRIELTYLIPYQSPMQLELRSLYDSMVTRVAAPAGVTLSGDGLQSMPENPQIKASVFSVPQVKAFALAVSGEGRLSRGREASAESGGEGADSISVIPAAIHNQLPLVLGFTLVILAVGFYALYSASPAVQAEKAEKPAEKPAKQRGRRKA